MKLKLEGIWTPIPTPLTKQGRVDIATTRKLVDFHIEAGIDGLLPLGTSGEFALLSREERSVLVNTVVDQADNRVPVVVGVSDPSIENVIQLSSDAKKAGADAVIATPPYYFTTTDEGHYQHFKAISETIDLPLLIYNIRDCPKASRRETCCRNEIYRIQFSESCQVSKDEWEQDCDLRWVGRNGIL
jgi:4-hydroxy-tetrahydrodipicolinate synthase